MRTLKKNLIRLSAFLICIGCLIWGINGTVTAKYMYDQREPHTETYKGFYRMDRNTVDVLILGTSHSAAGFNPQDFYDADHLRTYNLSSSAQPVWLSYYWLEEALKYQTPSVVVFDCYYMFSNYNDEGAIRKALDSMRWGETKLNAVQSAVKYDTETKESMISYVFPFFRYHSRWTSLNSRDFTWAGDIEKPSSLKGFWFYLNRAQERDFQPLVNDDPGTEPALFKETALEYLTKMKELCDENGIKLIITKTPSHPFSQAKHNAVSLWAAENSVDFVDFNVKELFESVGFSYGPEDMNEIGDSSSHCNPSGARKLSDYLSDFITANGYAQGVEDTQWETTRDFNAGLYKDFELRNVSDGSTYLKMLEDERYSVMISLNGEDGKSIPEDIRKELHDLGLNADLGSEETGSYLALLDRNKLVYEHLGSGPDSFAGCIRKGLVRVEMYSSADSASVKTDDEQYSKNFNGLNIVVYNNDRHCVIDSVCIDVYGDQPVCYR